MIDGRKADRPTVWAAAAALLSAVAAAAATAAGGPAAGAAAVVSVMVSWAAARSLHTASARHSARQVQRVLGVLSGPRSHVTPGDAIRAVEEMARQAADVESAEVRSRPPADGEVGFLVTDGKWLVARVDDGEDVDAAKAVLRGVADFGGALAENALLQEKVRFQAMHDALTGLPNRRSFDEELGRAVARARRGGGKVAVVYADLTRFKPVNDTYGHDAGDELLRQVASCVAAAAREGEMAARIGGDEFAVVLPGVTGREQADAAAERVRRSIAGDYPLSAAGGVAVHADASVGAALWPDDSKDAAGLLRAADRLMYERKQLGRGDPSSWR